MKDFVRNINMYVVFFGKLVLTFTYHFIKNVVVTVLQKEYYIQENFIICIPNRTLIKEFPTEIKQVWGIT